MSCTGTEWGFNHFTDDFHDGEDTLEHTWFRQLSTTQGRWMGTDPYLGSMDLTNPQSINRYAYVVNDPSNLFDLSGLDYGYIDGNCAIFGTTTNTMDGGKMKVAVVETDVCSSAPSGPTPETNSGGGGSGADVSSNGMPAIPVPPGTPSSCAEQLGDMLNDINAARGDQGSQYKGLGQRFAQILRGSHADAGHIRQFQDRQTNLQRKIQNYRDSGCGDPPAQITGWADLPTASPWAPPDRQNFSVPSWVVPAAIITAGVACAVLVPGCLEVEAAGLAVAP